jgi:molybdenum cofactor biosynthesis enzyme MoaA
MYDVYLHSLNLLLLNLEQNHLFDNVIYSTFCDACQARGLLEHDGKWMECLHDANLMQTGKQLENAVCHYSSRLQSFSACFTLERIL